MPTSIDDAARSLGADPDGGQVPAAVTETLAVMAETAWISKRVVETGRTLIRKTVTQRDEVLEAVLNRHDVTVERVPVGRVVTEAPAARQEGGAWIFPIVEEVLVTEKRLVLREELHVRHTETQEPVSRTVTLRTEHAGIEHIPTSHAKEAAMSGSNNNRDAQSEMLNANAAHDTGLYDPARHDNQIVAVFETRARAEYARDALISNGVSADAVQVLDRTASGEARDDNEGGFWGAIKSLFAPDEDTTSYEHALHRGHAMVVVHPSASMDRSAVIQTLERTDPVDFDAKLEEWRQSGYDYSARPAPSLAAAGIAPPAPSTPVNPGLPPSIDTGYRSAAAPTPAPAPVASADTGAAPDTIKIVEENLRVGKREVAAGAVRVRSYVVERPVEAQVRLHEERITIERRPVDRAATAADLNPFEERTIEARATAEEAVVNKEARIVEEIGIRKEGTDRTETVRDTVRKTEVEVDDTTGAVRAPGTNPAAPRS